MQQTGSFQQQGEGQGGASSSLAAKVSAREFVPAPPGIPGALSKSGSTASLHKIGSSSSLTAAALNAPVFVPGVTGGVGRPSAVDAKPFVPGTKQVSKPPKGSPVKPAKQPPQQHQQQHAAQPSGRVSTPDLGLPEGDDLLGMTAVTPGDGKDVAMQAAEMFRALNPFPPGGGGGGRGRPGQPPPGAQQQQRAQRPGGTGRGGPPPPGYSAPGPPTAAAGGGRGGQGAVGGRGRGRGRRAGPAPNRPSAAYMTGPGRMLKAGHFASDALRQELQHRSYLIQAQPNHETEGDYGMPEVVQQYTTIYPLEDVSAAGERLSQALGVRTQVVKSINRIDGQAYVLRRIDPRQVIPTAELLAAAEEAVERWGVLANHPNLVGLREAFIAGEVDNTPALFFAHDYHPGSLTLEQAHIQPAQTQQGLMRNPATEEQLWSYLIQLTAALRSVHSAGLALRPAALAPSKVLLTTNGRVRVACTGVPEVLASEGGGGPPPVGGPEAAALQRQDLCALGNLLLVLACAGRGAAPSLDYVTAHFSREFCHVVAGLLAAGEGNGFASWRSLMAALGDRVFAELDGANLYADALMAELGKETENGRMLRVLVKLNTVTERPELGGDPQWSETGDRYVAKLFRDFVFHQVDEVGSPVLDYGLVAEALNKLDAGVPEKILLLSRDEVSMLVVSYADVKRCIQNSYAELRARSSSVAIGGVLRSKSKQELRGQQMQQQQRGEGERERGGAGSAGSYY